jgi:ribonuclease VapC
LIAIDTSALIAILQGEPAAEACMDAIENADGIVMSAATMAEVLIVSARRELRSEMETFLSRLGLTVVEITPATAQRVADVYDVWGKGVHPAELNFGDCFAYEVAQSHNCPLLYIGNDFARTDIVSVLPRSASVPG